MNAPRHTNLRQPLRSAKRLRPRILHCAIAASFALSAPTFANPTGAQVTAGQASFTQSGNTLTIANTPNAIINWASFNVAPLDAVRFQQQSALSSVLNRVTGNEASAIYGQLSSNGHVWLINPNGILFGQGSRIDIPGFIASTLNISDSDFLAGKMNFNAGPVAGSIKNQGTLSNAGSGNIYLIAPDIENAGIIKADNGDVLLTAGRQVNLVDSGHPDIQVVVSAPDDKAVNLGEVITRNGKISLMGAVLQQRGKLSADSIEVDDYGRIIFRGTQKVELATGSSTSANGIKGGEVSIRNSGDTYVSGNISATGSQGQGGIIEVLGKRVAVTDNAVIDASGDTGGGRIMIGGDYQGKNADVPNSTITFFGPEATLKANATRVGDGGTAIVWADDTTRAYGMISARGGAVTGNGGFVETSGHRYLDVNGVRVSTLGAGKSGTWLLDPTDITIVYGGGSDTGGSFGVGVFAPSAAASTIYAGTINSNLYNGDVTINSASSYGGATGNITFDASSGAIGITNITTAQATRTLTLAADGDIVFSGGTTTFGSTVPYGLGITLNPIGKVQIGAGATVSLDGTGVLYGGVVTTLLGGKVWDNVNAGTLNITGNAAVKLGAGSTFYNHSGGITNVSVGSTQAHAFDGATSTTGTIKNEGTINVTAGSATFFAVYDQPVAGTPVPALNIGTNFLYLPNTLALTGTADIGTGGALFITEYQGTTAALSALTVTRTTGTGLGAIYVSGGTPPRASFSNVSAPNTLLSIGNGTENGVVSITGNSIFSDVAFNSGTLALNNAILGITSAASFTVPSIVTYTGNVGYAVGGNLILPTPLTAPANLTLVAGWNGVSLNSPAVGSVGGISATDAIITASGVMNIKAAGDVTLTGSTMSSAGASQTVESGGNVYLTANANAASALNYTGTGTQTIKALYGLTLTGINTTNIHTAKVNSGGSLFVGTGSVSFSPSGPGAEAELNATGGAVRLNTNGLYLPPDASIHASTDVELGPLGSTDNMWLNPCDCTGLTFSASSLSRIFPNSTTGVLILGRPVADTSYSGTLTITAGTTIPSSAINGSKLALNGYNVVIEAGNPDPQNFVSNGSIGDSTTPFNKPLDILANSTVTINGDIYLDSTNTTNNLTIKAGQLDFGNLDLNGAMVTAGNISLQNLTGGISGTAPLHTVGNLTIDASNVVSLVNATSSVGGLLTLTMGAANSTIEVGGPLSLGTVSIGTTGNRGSLDVTAGGTITVTQPIDVTECSDCGNTLSLTSNNGSILLNAAIAGDSVSLTAGPQSAHTISGSGVITDGGMGIGLTAGGAIGTSSALLQTAYGSTNTTNTTSINFNSTYGGAFINNAGALDISSSAVYGGVLVTAGGALGVGVVSSTNGPMTLRATGGDLTLKDYVSVAGNANIVFDAGANNFINLSQSPPSTGGRWLVFTANPTGVNKGGLTSSFRQYNTVYGGTINTATGNGFIYSSPATLYVDLTLASGAVSNTTGSPPTAQFGASFASYGSGLDIQDQNLAMSGGLPALGVVGYGGPVTTSPVISSSTSAGTYSLFYSSGLSSAAKYTFAAGANGLPYQVLAPTVQATTYRVNTILRGGSATHTYGQTPTAVFGYSLGSTVQYGETVSGTAAFTPTIGRLTSAGVFTVLYSTGLSSSVGSTFVAGSGLTYTINPAVLSAVLAGTASKMYDGTALATLAPSNFLLTGFVGSDLASVTKTSGTYANTHARSQPIGVSVTLATSDYAFSQGSASNYTLPVSAAGSIGTIRRRPLTVGATIGGTTTKMYDGTTAATGATVTSSFVGQLAGDSFALSGLNLAYNDAHVLMANAILAKGTPALSLTNSVYGSVASDYSFALPTVSSVAASITARPLTSTVTIGGTTTKMYDGTTAATGATLTSSFVGQLAGDSFALSGLNLAYNDAHVLMANAILAKGTPALSLTNSVYGSVASDYSFALPTISSIAASITARPLTSTVTIGGTTTKMYDGTLAAIGALATGSVTGGLPGDTLAADTTGLVLAYDSSHVIAASSIGATGSAAVSIINTADGSLATDYSMTTLPIVSMKASITPLQVAATAIISGTTTKVYDGTTIASGAIVNGSITGGLTGDTLTLDTSKLALAYNDAHVNGATSIAASGTATLAISNSAYGSAATDYAVSLPALPTTGGRITAKPLTASATIGGITSKIYDGNVTASGAAIAGSVGGAVDGDSLAFDVSGVSLAYNSARVKEATAIVATGAPVLSITSSTHGSVVGDYLYVAPSIANGPATISERALTVGAISALNKTYDGSTAAKVGSVTFANIVGNDAVSVSVIKADFDTKNVGDGKPVSFAGGLLGGNDASNYALPTTWGSAKANITKLDSVAWLGGSGNWSQASSWYGGAIPDLSNVANVSLPAGSSVTFDGLSASLSSLSSSGTLIMQAGTLDTGTLSTAGYQQNGGTLGTGTMTVSQAFAKAAGTGTLNAGLINIAQAAGELTFYNDKPVTVGTITATSGNILIDAIGGIRNRSGVSAPRGTITFNAHSPIVLDGPVTAQGSITLTAGATGQSGDDLTINAPISSSGGGAITLSAGDNLAQNANISTDGGGITANAVTGSISMTSGVSTQSGGGAISYSAPVSIQLALLDAGTSGKIDLATSGSITSAPGQTGSNIRGGTATISAKDANLQTSVSALGGTVSGTLSLKNNGQIITTVTRQPTPVESTASVGDKITCLIDPTACFSDTGSTANQSAIDNTLQQIKQNQQAIADITTVVSTKPGDLVGGSSSGELPSGGVSGFNEGAGTPVGVPPKEEPKKDELKKDESNKEDENKEEPKKDRPAKKDEPVKKLYCN